MNLIDSKTHKRLEKFCEIHCTRKGGWNIATRMECRNSTMCTECRDILKATDTSSRGIEVAIDKIQQSIMELDTLLKEDEKSAWITLPFGNLTVNNEEIALQIGYVQKYNEK